MATEKQNNDINTIPTPLEFIKMVDAEILTSKGNSINISIKLATKYNLIITSESEEQSCIITWQNGSEVIINGDKEISAKIDAKHLTKAEQDIFTEEIHMVSGVSSGSNLCSPWNWGGNSPILKGKTIEEMAEQLYKDNASVYIEDYLDFW